HLRHLQPRHVRRARVRRHHQSAAGDHSCGRRRAPAGGRDRGRRGRLHQRPLGDALLRPPRGRRCARRRAPGGVQGFDRAAGDDADLSVSMAEKTDILLIGPRKPVIVEGLAAFNLVALPAAGEREKFFAANAPGLRAIACAATSERIDGEFMRRLPRLEIVSSFGVGYDHVDAQWAGAHGITVTNTPDVLTEEAADTALGLLLCTVRELPQAERYLRAGKWRQKDYPLSKATLRDRTVGLVGMGRIGQAIARRLDAMQVPVVYHSRRPATGVSYRH